MWDKPIRPIQFWKFPRYSMTNNSQKYWAQWYFLLLLYIK